jgi:hypothetical protein
MSDQIKKAIFTFYYVALQKHQTLLKGKVGKKIILHASITNFYIIKNHGKKDKKLLGVVFCQRNKQEH